MKSEPPVAGNIEASATVMVVSLAATADDRMRQSEISEHARASASEVGLGSMVARLSKESGCAIATVHRAHAIFDNLAKIKFPALVTPGSLSYLAARQR